MKQLNWRRLVIAPVVLAFVLLIILGVLVERQSQQIAEGRLRAEYISKLSVISAKLESNVQSNMQLVKGLAAAVANDTVIDEQRFRQNAAGALDGNSQIRSVAIAPDFIISMVYPRTGNQAQLGIDFRDMPDQWPAVERLITTGESHFVGPVNLVQGGQGFLARMPVYDKVNGKLWGLVSAVVDAPRLMASSGIIENRDFDLSVKIVTRDFPEGNRIFGRDLSDLRPVYADVKLSDGLWRLSAHPKSGWGMSQADTWLLRGLLILAGVFILLPLAVSARMVSERHNYTKQLAERAQQLDAITRRFHLALDVSKVGVWEVDVETGLETWDQRTNHIYGFANDGAPRTYENWLAAVHPEDREKAADEFSRMVSEGRSESVYRVIDKDGRIRHVRSVGAFYSEPGQPEKIIGVNFDITEDVELHKDLVSANRMTEARNKELEAARISIEYNSLHDSLTGLPNRRYLDEILVTHQSDGYYGSGSIALLHIDLDRFKQINDTLGHAAGDAMLVHASKVLRANCRETDFVARIGGDEFVIVSSAGASDDRLILMAERIVKQMQKPVMHDGHECRFGVSVGLAISREAVCDVKQLLVNADIALYRAKRRGRNRYEFFSQELQNEVVLSKRTADEILNGLDSNAFIAYYQPQFDATTLAITGVEALVRWRHPTDGILAPDRFMKIAEELNVVPVLDRIVLDQVLSDMKRWDKLGLNIPHASVNVSLWRLHDENLPSTLRTRSIEPGRISFELVESIYLDENDSVVSQNIDQLKALGIEIEIDDFGTGYASIVSLQKLRPRRLKIDRQLIGPIVDVPAQRRLLASIVDIGKAMEIEIVAEGVETMEHAAVLRDLGCDILQGYALGRPMSVEALENFILQTNLRHTG